MSDYVQLPLNGEENDYYNTEALLIGHKELCKAIDKFYVDNEEFNPRQLCYYITNEVHTAHLELLLGLIGTKRHQKG